MTKIAKGRQRPHLLKGDGGQGMVLLMQITPRILWRNWLKMIKKANGVEYVWGFHPAYQGRQYCCFGIKS